jgi:predicted metal-dependent peptidase
MLALIAGNHYEWICLAKLRDWIQAVDIFVDNSGSVTDQEIVQTLTTLEKMLKKTKTDS